MVDRFFGHYQILGEAGYGGMGAVYRAQDTRSGQQVAIKLLPAEYLDDLGLRASFYREAQLVAGLEHEGIVPVRDFGEQDGQPYIAMEFMPNGSLADRLVHGPISAEDVLPILERLCAAIDYAHEQGIIHGDIKPSNILFAENDRPYLADFGIAWQVAATRGSGPASGGTPAYLSPEQALSDGKIDGRSDIYAMGIILFEMLTGVLPFEGETPLAVILMHVYDPPPSLRAVDWKLPASLDEVVQRALAKNPAERYSSAGELLQAYQRALVEKEQVSPPAEILAHEPPDETATGVARERGALKYNSPSRRRNELPLPPVIFDLPVPDGGSSTNVVPEAEPLGSWGCAHLLTLGLATVFSILLAAGLVAFIRLAAVKPSQPGILMTYDGPIVSLTNRSGAPLDVSNLVFRRFSKDGKVVATFPASDWLQLPAGKTQNLQPGACLQLLDPQKTTFKLAPGEAPPKPASCNKLQAWLAVNAQDWLFWVPQDGSTSFQVLFDSRVIKTCPIAGGVCEFALTQP
jgi:serine/threonine protein kinase